MMKRQITNSEYEKAFNDPANKKVLNYIASKFKYVLNYDDIDSVKMQALWSALINFKPDNGAKFQTYLSTVAYRKFQREAKNNPRATSYNEKYLQEVLAHNKVQEKVRDIYSSLEGDEFNIVKMKFTDKKTYVEIANILGIGRNDVRKRLRKILQSLKY